MAKSEQQIREEFRRLVILLNHKDCETFEEAVKKEIVFGCKFIYKGEVETVGTEFFNNGEGYSSYQESDIIEVFHDYSGDTFDKILPDKILGLPITLPRVLTSLPYPFEIYSNIDRSNSVQITCNDIRATWQLTKENGQELCADSQSIETIQALLKILQINST